MTTIPEYSPYSEEVLADPWPVYRHLRDHSPAHYVKEYDAWALSRFEDVWRASTNRDDFTAAYGTSLEALLRNGNARQPGAFLFRDPPEHRRHRGMIAGHYGREAIPQLEDEIRGTVRRLLDERVSRGELDVYELGSATALSVIAAKLGLRFEEVVHIRQLVDQFFHREPGVTGTTEDGMKAAMEARDYILDRMDHYRLNGAPSGSHIDTWLNVPLDGELLDTESVYFNIFALCITGSDTVPLTTAGTVYQLSRHPQQRDEVLRDPSLIPHAFAETARYDQPTHVLGRRVVRPVEFHGRTFEPGSTVLFLFSSANRDEREFERPDVYHIHRRPRRTLSFGAGFHVCLGQHLARLEGRILLEEIFSALPDAEVDHTRCRRVKGEFLQGYCSVPLKL